MIMQLRFTNKNGFTYRSYQTNRSEKWTENWCVDGFINQEEPFSGWEELNLKPVSCGTKTNCVQQLRDQDTLIAQPS